MSIVTDILSEKRCGVENGCNPLKDDNFSSKSNTVSSKPPATKNTENMQDKTQDEAYIASILYKNVLSKLSFEVASSLPRAAGDYHFRKSEFLDKTAIFADTATSSSPLAHFVYGNTPTAHALQALTGAKHDDPAALKKSGSALNLAGRSAQFALTSVGTPMQISIAFALDEDATASEKTVVISSALATAAYMTDAGSNSRSMYHSLNGSLGKAIGWSSLGRVANIVATSSAVVGGIGQLVIEGDRSQHGEPIKLSAVAGSARDIANGIQGTALSFISLGQAATAKSLADKFSALTGSVALSSGAQKVLGGVGLVGGGAGLALNGYNLIDAVFYEPEGERRDEKIISSSLGSISSGCITAGSVMMAIPPLAPVGVAVSAVGGLFFAAQTAYDYRREFYDFIQDAAS